MIKIKSQYTNRCHKCFYSNSLHSLICDYIVVIDDSANSLKATITL